MRRTVVVSGPLAFKMRRLRAAQDCEIGLEVLTLPLLASRLAGGFVQPAPMELVQQAVRLSLAAGGFKEIEGVRDLPGMIRAVTRTLRTTWKADIDLAERAKNSARLGDLALIESRVRESLPNAYMIPPDLRAAALTRVKHAPALLGDIVLDGLVDVDPVWRPLLAAIGEKQPIHWRAMGQLDRAWFQGTLETVPSRALPKPIFEICADPRAEVVEALRWARRLLSRGDVLASEVAIAAATTEAWDEHMLALSREAQLPLHFTHGVPALDSREGQACAALADVLLRGLSQSRLRRLLRRVPPRGLPLDWHRGLSRTAGLFTEEHWVRALALARSVRASREAAETVLGPLIGVLTRGPPAAAEAGERLLRGNALRLWRTALQAAPPEALEHALASLRVADSEFPGACIAWGPAAHLVSAPRKYVRLLGLTARGWPQASSEDPLLPEHVLPRAALESIPRSDLDCLLFEAISNEASGELVLTRCRRSSEGQLLPPSRLWPRATDRVLARTRIPEHAFSESDRLLARPNEAASDPRLALSRACWRDWSRPEFTAHDGEISRAHPIIEASLRRPKSIASLRRLLRDPLAYLWVDALGWSQVETSSERLALDAREFGELVHEILRRAVDSLELEGAVARASSSDLANAIDEAVRAVGGTWPLVRPVPPPLLWRRTLDKAARLALQGLTVSDTFRATQSWAEVVFGEKDARPRPWSSDKPIVFAGLNITGRIDRLDLRGVSDAAQVIDYKTGAVPKNPERTVLGHGAELQRVVYAAAVRELLPDIRELVSKLVYLGNEPSQYAISGDVLDKALGEIAGYIAASVRLLKSGKAPPGPDAQATFNDMRLALPADLDLYLRRKRAAFAASSEELAPLWRRP